MFTYNYMYMNTNKYIYTMLINTSLNEKNKIKHRESRVLQRRGIAAFQKGNDKEKVIVKSSLMMQAFEQRPGEVKDKNLKKSGTRLFQVRVPETGLHLGSLKTYPGVSEPGAQQARNGVVGNLRGSQTLYG